MVCPFSKADDIGLDELVISKCAVHQLFKPFVTEDHEATQTVGGGPNNSKTRLTQFLRKTGIIK